MIRITVELLPHGDESRARVIGLATITNDGTGTDRQGNYKLRFWNGGVLPWRTGRLEGFPRKSRNVWHLLQRFFGENTL